MIAAGLVTLSRPARAQDFPATDPGFNSPPRVGIQLGEVFGAKGQIVLRSDFDLSFIYTASRHTATRPPGVPETTSITAISVAPALDVFVARNFAVGGKLLFSYQTGKPGGASLKALGLGVGPEIGYNVPISGKASFFPKIGVAYGRNSLTTDSPIGGSTTASKYSVALFASLPVLVHPAEHFFAGFGPIVHVDLVAKAGSRDTDKLRQFGVAFDIGGWF
jgi:hypothetical protein